MLSLPEFEGIKVEFSKFWKVLLVLAAPEESQFKYFEVSPNSFAKRKKHLYHSFGGLSPDFTGTAYVESDILLVNYKATHQRQMLFNLSLAGILHSKQWDRVRGVTVL